ncbi:efflux RND transporter permease subunit [Paenibacillus alginolyticus]|uniref:Efflux RND transporter permease subunit n=1 Tax=Paenibacillus alginolyticus TaxID=59839 RepID=A0ABT4GEW1_9BACL|nr:efflux RND transporter permease subunit [Paenibacillus alginolyticus]MCY9664167.1 efflux RND transporter permease subunit [Paenibacillus alginolyticus]MCY9694724.1 efflux RND transporter permease subunit [Paenibacillus alginolyticus]MEC0147105.1 efflux RND transporter permease subunit [Paenibacillus alginolyticus]
MNRLTQFSMKNVSALFIIMIMLFVGGFYSSTQLKVENMPNVSFPVVAVTTTYTGAPKDVMDEITAPIEEKLANIEDLDSMSSTSSDNFSTIIIMFKQNVDIDKKKQAVQDMLAQVSLPATAGAPKASTFGAASFPSNYLVAYAKDGVSQTELDKSFKDKIKPGLEGIKGIDHMNVIGSRSTSLDIELDAAALDVYGLSPALVSNAINSAATKSPIGSVEISGNNKMTRVTGNLSSLYDLEQVEITTPKGDIVTLAQVSKVKAITESNFNGRLDGKPAIGMILYKAGSANAVDFSGSIEKQIHEWETTLPNITFKNTYDSADQIKTSIAGLVREGVVGAVLASLMILIFLRNIRMTLIVLVSIPLSILITLLLMSQLNLTLNTMTLGGIFIAVGRVVDDSIVVIENIYASLEKAQERKESVIALATKQVSMAITSSTLATVGVFAPLALVTGVVGGFFRPFALTIACALLSSLIVALTVIPMLAKLLVLRSKPGKGHHDESKPTKLTAFYEKALTWSLKNRIKTLLISGLLLVVTIAATVPFLSVSFLPSSKPSTTMYFQLKMPYATSFEATDAKTKEIEAVLLDTKDSNGEPVFKFVEALVGYAGKDDERTPYASQIFVQVNDKVNPNQVKDQMKAYILSELPSGSEVVPKSMEGDFGVSSTDFAYTLQGEDQLQLEKAAGLVKEKLNTFTELSEIGDNLSDAKTEIEIAVDQKKARAYGLSSSTVRDIARAWIQKQKLGDMKFDNIVYTTTVSLDKSDKDTLEKLGNIPLTGSNGSKVLLKEVAKVTETKGAASLAREKQQQLVKVTAKINSADKTGVSAKLSAALKDIQLPEGVTPKISGVSDDVNDSFKQLFIAMAAAIFVVYLIMVLAFGNASAPFAILFSLPLAVIGGLLGLVIAREPLTVTSMIGFLMLIGIVVTNAIVLIDRAQQLREDGYTVRHALIEAGKVRLRPIIMTAGATIMALVPLALGISGEGGLIGKGLGVVVIGGLITSTLLTLVVVPIVYELIESIKNRIGRMFNRKKGNEKTTISTLEV